LTKVGNLPFSDSRCGARWSGLATCHCAACHESFTSVSGFDAHRTGEACKDPAAIGMARADRTDQAWTFLATDADRERLGRLRSKSQDAV